MSIPSSPTPTLGKSGKPTLRTISELSGLAVPTVSRALSDAPDIGAATKTLVRKIASEIGYVPNRAGVRLRTGRTNVISLVLSTENEMLNFTARLIYAVAGELRDTRYHMIVTPYFAGDDPMQPIRYIVETGSADAVIFNQVQKNDPRVDYLLERRFPFAAHGRSARSDDHAWCDFDNAAYGARAVQEMAARGRTRIALIAPPMDQNYATEMLSGAQQAAAATGVTLVHISEITSDDTDTALRSGVEAMLRADSALDGILTGSANAAMSAVAGIEACGRHIGTDIDLYSKESSPFLKLLRNGILLQTEDVSATGAFLARSAIHAATEPNADPMQLLLQPQDPA